MTSRVLGSVAFGALVFLHGHFAAAEPMPLLKPYVVCMPSAAQADSDVFDASHGLCLLRLAPWFEGASFELMPRFKLTRRTQMKHLGADFEFRF